MSNVSCVLTCKAALRTASSEGDADGARCDGKEAAADDRIDAVTVSFGVLGLGAKQGRDIVG